jgi:hypothetical protein
MRIHSGLLATDTLSGTFTVDFTQANPLTSVSITLITLVQIVCQCGNIFFETASGSLGSIVNGTAVPLSAVPLPTALPLFATGLGALGLLGWRRKRKAAALAA